MARPILWQYGGYYSLLVGRNSLTYACASYSQELEAVFSRIDLDGTYPISFFSETSQAERSRLPQRSAGHTTTDARSKKFSRLFGDCLKGYDFWTLLCFVVSTATVISSLAFLNRNS